MTHIINIDLEIEVGVPSVNDKGGTSAQCLVEKGVGGEVLVEADFNALGSRRQA